MNQWQEGWNASAGGRYTNPYPVGSRDYFMWQDGYDDHQDVTLKLNTVVDERMKGED